jgi:hypothetical protein
MESNVDADMGADIEGLEPLVRPAPPICGRVCTVLRASGDGLTGDRVDGGAMTVMLAGGEMDAMGRVARVCSEGGMGPFEFAAEVAIVASLPSVD